MNSPEPISIKENNMMSDNNRISGTPGLSAATEGDSKTESQAAALDKDQLAPFTYPEGFNAVANSLQSLPEELRATTLAGLAMVVLMM
jgi:hypothetical protein